MVLGAQNHQNDENQLNLKSIKNPLKKEFLFLGLMNGAKIERVSNTA